jgi:hypothetical protein
LPCTIGQSNSLYEPGSLFDAGTTVLRSTLRNPTCSHDQKLDCFQSLCSFWSFKARAQFVQVSIGSSSHFQLHPFLIGVIRQATNHYMPGNPSLIFLEGQKNEANNFPETSVPVISRGASPFPSPPVERCLISLIFDTPAPRVSCK